jgi:hypothetical protein
MMMMMMLMMMMMVVERVDQEKLGASFLSLGCCNTGLLSLSHADPSRLSYFASFFSLLLFLKAVEIKLMNDPLKEQHGLSSVCGFRDVPSRAWVSLTHSLTVPL